jgi:hypothetical protein
MEWAINRLACGTAEEVIVVHLPTKIKNVLITIPRDGKKSTSSKE